jgi:hypothetical protein
VSSSHPEIFVTLREILFLETGRSHSKPNQGRRVVFHFTNRFSGQKVFDRGRPVSWSIIMLESAVVGAKFRPFPAHVAESLPKFICIAMALILKRVSVCIRFRTFSTFSWIL